jgi:hypothetical protein
LGAVTVTAEPVMEHWSGCIQVTNCCCPSSFAKNARQYCQKSFIRPYCVGQQAWLAQTSSEIDRQFYSLLMPATKAAKGCGNGGSHEPEVS